MSENGGGKGRIGSEDGGDDCVSIWRVRACGRGNPEVDEGLVRIVYFAGGREPSVVSRERK